MMPESPKLTTAMIESRIHDLNGVRVMLDFELAELYGVETKALNQAVERNLDRFPSDFSHVLDAKELAALRSQIVTSKPGKGGRRYRPRVFTEHGVAMLASVLRSPMAVKVNIEIIRAFVKMRRLLATPCELLKKVQRLRRSAETNSLSINLIARFMNITTPPEANP
jgi:ORF6N domain